MFSLRRLKPTFVLCIYLASTMMPILNTMLGSSIPYASATEDRVISVEYTENELVCDMRWGNFLGDCTREGAFLSVYGSPQDIAFQMEMNFDKGTIRGSLSGSYTYDMYNIKQGMTFAGDFTGSIGKYNWNYNSWFWEFGSNFTVSLGFRMEQLCRDEQGNQFWNSREEAIQVIAQLSGDSFAGRGGIGMLNVNWEDPGAGVESSRYFRMRCKNYLSSGGCDLPAELPSVIDIDAEITGPATVQKTDSSVIFDIKCEGTDLDQVTEVNWYFWYYDEGLQDFWWFETFQKTNLSPLEIDDEKIVEWAEIVTEYGATVNNEKRLLMQVLVELKAGENEWLFETDGFNFTYILKESSGFDLLITDSLIVYPTMKNETTFRLDHTGTQLSEKITFEIKETLPNYLKVVLQKTSSDKSPNGILENKITVSLDTSKATSLSLPMDQIITVVVKSKKGTDPVEASKQITLNLRPAKWLIMHYCASNTVVPLQLADIKNIQEIINALDEKKTPNVGYTLFIDLSAEWKPPSYKGNTALSRYNGHLLRYYDGELELLETSHDPDMSSPSTLSSFLEKAERTIPAEKKILIISDHGVGEKGIITEENKKIMKVVELDGALKNHKIDLLVLEACYMGQLQVLYELRDKSDYIISSQTIMNEYSFQYTDALRPLLNKPSTTTVQIGKNLIESFELKLNIEAVSLVDTAKIEAIVESENKLEKTIEKERAEKGEGYKYAIDEIKKYYNSLSDIRCYTENILKYEGLKETQTRTDAEALKNAVETAVLSYKMQVEKTLVVYSDGVRSLLPIDDLPDKPQTEGDRIRVGSVRQLFGIGAGYNWDDGLEYYSKYSWPNTITPNGGNRVEIKKDQKGNNLYIRVEDSEGRVNGFNPESEGKSRIELDYLEAEYIDYNNGTQVLILPSALEDFTTFVYGGYMEEPDESYTITYTLFQDDEIVSEKVVENPIHEYTEQSFTISISEGQIEVGEIVTTELERPVIDPETEPQVQPQTKGIPGYNTEATILGLILVYLIQCKKREPLIQGKHAPACNVNFGIG